MDGYPDELRTPPISLVSVVGVPELHSTISSFLHSEQPPINTLALPDFSKVAVMARVKPPGADSGPPAGILKREWLAKHRTRVPAVVAALFGDGQVYGDPAQWLQVCTDLENLKTVVRQRNSKLVVVLVLSTHRVDVGDERLIALRKRAEIDSKSFLLFAKNDKAELKDSLTRLASLFADLANAYYREEGKRVRVRVEKKNFSFPELHIRYCFKAAVFAEFRRDWTEALRSYEEGYNALREMIGKSTRLPPIQRLVEIKCVAEQFHFKISTLLLHGGKIVEAVTWFWKHVSSYKKLTGSDEAVFIHWEWVSKQFLVFAELLEFSSASVVNYGATFVESQLSEWEFRPAFFYQLAAGYLSDKRRHLDLALAFSPISGDLKLSDDSRTDSVISSVFIGQYVRLFAHDEEIIMQQITDEEYMVYALSEAKRFQDSDEIIALLTKSFEAYNALKSQRFATYCRNQIAREYFLAGDLTNAKQVYVSIADVYRKEGWLILLWEILGYLRDCSKRLGLVKDFIECSLEMSAMPTVFGFGMDSFDTKCDYGPGGFPSLQERENIQKEVFAFLSGDLVLDSNVDESRLDNVKDQSFRIEIDPVSPLRAALLVSVAFHDQSVKPHSSTLVTLSLLSHLPLPVEIDLLEVKFSQPSCNFVISKDCSGDHDQRVVAVPDLTLHTNKWMRLSCDLISGQSGKLECLSINIKIGQYFVICCIAESPASLEDLPLWKFEDRVESFPCKDLCLSLAGQKVVQVEEPDPLVDLFLCSSGLALVGEVFPVTVTVTSKGHQIQSGELKINLVDTRGGGLISPRDSEPFSFDNLHVELLEISGFNEETEFVSDTEQLRKTHQSFGLLSVPSIDSGETWTGKLEIRWHRPKLVMLYVSLGYSPNNDANNQRINVHKSLEIEGRSPLLFSHRFLLPFRKEPLLLSKLKSSVDSGQLDSLAMDEASVLIVSAQNVTEIPLRVASVFFDVERFNGEKNQRLVVHPLDEVSADLALLVPGEEYKQVYSITPRAVASKFQIGTVHFKWLRDQLHGDESRSEVISKYKIPDVNVEKAPFLVSFECPSHATLSIPFYFSVRIRNQTNLLQEITYSLTDSQNFVVCGPHNGSAAILPNSEATFSYNAVPLNSGQHQLPRVTIGSERYSARLKPSIASSSIFVFPSHPNFEISKDGRPKSSMQGEVSLS